MALPATALTGRNFRALVTPLSRWIYRIGIEYAKKYSATG